MKQMRAVCWRVTCWCVVLGSSVDQKINLRRDINTVESLQVHIFVRVDPSLLLLIVAVRTVQTFTSYLPV